MIGGVMIGLAPQITAGLTLAAAILTTGAFHEDGLADTADGFGGGSTRERKLEIMRDSRIGSYGGIALALSLLLRWSALVVLLAHGMAAAALVLIALAGATRTAALLPLVLLPPARQDGAAYAAERPQLAAYVTACVIAAGLLLLPVAAGVRLSSCVAALIAISLAGFALSALSKRQISGQTGDVAGAAQQLGEIVGLISFGLQL
jgi:adenosylcobinamide-GDP ribazoletransferase